MTNKRSSPARKPEAPRRPRGKGGEPSPTREQAGGIGTMKESSLHRALKFRYSGSGGATETTVGDYVCDGKTEEGEIIEVQTGSFGPLKEKVKRLAQSGKVRIIHPISAGKLIEVYDTEGGLLYKRKSPRKGSAWDLFKALVYAPELCLEKNLLIELAVIDVLEKRVSDGTGSWRRKGVRIDDKVLAAWHSSIILKKLKDYCQFVPFTKDELFTVSELGKKARINAGLAGKTLYVLAKIGLVERIGKRGNALVYKLR